MMQIIAGWGWAISVEPKTIYICNLTCFCPLHRWCNTALQLCNCTSEFSLEFPWSPVAHADHNCNRRAPKLPQNGSRREMLIWLVLHFTFFRFSHRLFHLQFHVYACLLFWILNFIRVASTDRRTVTWSHLARIRWESWDIYCATRCIWTLQLIMLLITLGPWLGVNSQLGLSRTDGTWLSSTLIISSPAASQAPTQL